MGKINDYISIFDKENGKVVEIDIYGDIEDKKFWDEDVTPKMIKDELKNNDNASILEIHVNSYGGSVGAGNGIIFIIDTFKKKTNCTVHGYCEGMCASMASAVLMCADKIFMANNALMLIHKPLMTVSGNANDFKDAISFLDKAETTLLKNYRRHWKGTEEELINALEATTIYTAEEALESGLCDEIIGCVKIVASAKGINIGNQKFGSKVSDMVIEKNITIEKEESKVVYNDALNEFGISKELFDSWEDKDVLLNVAKTISESVKPAVLDSTPEFMKKEHALKILGVEDVTAEEILNYAKSGMNPPDITEIQNKSNDYDKIVDAARSNALVSAFKAKGDTYNEARIKKILDVLNYQEILDQTKEWDEEAKLALHAGVRNSVPESKLENHNKEVNVDDYKV